MLIVYGKPYAFWLCRIYILRLIEISVDVMRYLTEAFHTRHNTKTVGQSMTEYQNAILNLELHQQNNEAY